MWLWKSCRRELCQRAFTLLSRAPRTVWRHLKRSRNVVSPLVFAVQLAQQLNHLKPLWVDLALVKKCWPVQIWRGMGKVHQHNKSPSSLFLRWGARVQWSLKEKTAHVQVQLHRSWGKEIWAYQNKKANTCSEEAIPSASQKKKKKQTKNPNIPKNNYLSIGRKSWRRGKKKKRSAEDTSSGVRSTKWQVMNAGEPNGGNRYRELRVLEVPVPRNQRRWSSPLHPSLSY